MTHTKWRFTLNHAWYSHYEPSCNASASGPTQNHKSNKTHHPIWLLVSGNPHRKAPYLLVKSMTSCHLFPWNEAIAPFKSMFRWYDLMISPFNRLNPTFICLRRCNTTEMSLKLGNNNGNYSLCSVAIHSHRFPSGGCPPDKIQNHQQKSRNP